MAVKKDKDNYYIININNININSKNNYTKKKKQKNNKLYSIINFIIKLLTSKKE